MIKKAIKICVTLLVVVLLWTVAQALLIPKYTGDCTTIVDGYYALEDNSVDSLFLGASQMYCTVDAQKLTEEYGIPSYDFGCSSQNLTISYYYLREALKTQTPDVVMVEVCQIFNDDDTLEEDAFAWSYTPMKLTADKIKSLYRVMDGDIKQVISYAFPLLQYHSRWKEVWVEDATYWFADKEMPSRGFLLRDSVTPEKIAYLSDDDGKLRNIPQDCIDAVDDVAALCAEKGVKLVFFKSPVTTWTRTDSAVVKSFMEDRGLAFLDLNDRLEDIGIDADTDFYDESHLNGSGAAKTTDFLAKYLKELSSAGI